MRDTGEPTESRGGVTYWTMDVVVAAVLMALGMMMVREQINAIANFPLDLRSEIEHLIASHHGVREHGSPVEPKTIEAFIVASIDELDARLNQVRKAIADDPGDEEFTAWNKRLGRVLYKSPHH